MLCKSYYIMGLVFCLYNNMPFFFRSGIKAANGSAPHRLAVRGAPKIKFEDGVTLQYVQARGFYAKFAHLF